METPGERLRYIREKLISLPLSVMAKRHNLNRHQIYDWESGRLQVKPKVLNIYIPCLQKEGIEVDTLWILKGTGKPPFKKDLIREAFYPSYPIVVEEIPESIIMVKDSNSFLLNHSNPVCIFVDSNDMRPFYDKGDYVCGDLVFGIEQVKSLIGCNCIIFTEKNTPFIGCILSINSNNTFNVGNNGLGKKAKLENIVINSAAEIILHRKVSTSS